MITNKTGLCIQLILYIIFAIISIVAILIRPLTTLSSKIIAIVSQLVINVLIGALIYWLCSKCYKTAAWIVLFFPVIFSIIFIIIALMGIGIGASVIAAHRMGNPNKRQKHR